MKHVSIIGKFLTIMIAFGLFALLASGYAVYQIAVIDAEYTHLLNSEAVATTLLARANRSMQASRASIGDLLIAQSEAGNASALKELESSKASFIDFTNKAKEAVPSYTAIEKLQADGLRIINEACAGAIKAGSQGSASIEETKAAQELFLQDCQPQFAAITPAFTQAVNDIYAESSNKSDQLSDLADQTKMITMTGVLIGLATTMLAGFFAMRGWLVRPIRDLASTMNVLANGDLNASVANTDRRDEVGGMARAVQVFKDNGLAAQATAKDAEAARSANEAQRARVAEQDRQRAQEMAQATEGLAQGLEKLSKGDLTFQLDQAFATDFESLRLNFNRAVLQLAETLVTVSETSGQIDTGAREISQSAADLSKRTEQQAASLEETAAALDQITTNVKNASQRTEEARQVAIEANQSARRSAEVVSSAVDAMQRIEQSSSQISNIIGVIDEIAFQTNLLALNAGVEAARAGEAGKGFAVVAQEVRELAQRSAQAAKEIKGLISNSVQEVSTGVKLVQDTGSALAIIEQQVVSINSQLDAIATSAREQSVGLAEVNTAVNQMDQVTQQNAAMVEQSTAASSALANEVLRLREIISQFNVGTRHAAPQQTRPAPARASHAPQPSPARRMMAKVASAVGMGNTAEKWDEF